MKEKKIKAFQLHCGKCILNLSERPHIMGILNVTPDSFSDGGQFIEEQQALDHAFKMQEAGADIIDIGGESTRPGADPVSQQEELDRVIPVIQSLRGKLDIPVSIDTYKSNVAKAALDAGASMINDISGLRFDPEMPAVAAKYQVPVVVMHIKGTPKNMQKNPVYSDLIGEMSQFLKDSVKIAEEAGIPRDQVIIDPGIGFGKSVKDNFIILNRLNEFHSIECPVLIGVSRKSFIGKTLDIPEKERLMGTAAAVAVSVIKGAHILRVHDVSEMNQVIRIASEINKTI